MTMLSLLLGTLRSIQTLDYSYGAGDVIRAGAGDNIVLGGTGADAITTGEGADVIVGDQGATTFNPDGVLEVVKSTKPEERW